LFNIASIYFLKGFGATSKTHPEEKTAMKRAIYYLVSLLALTTLIAGCSGTPAQNPTQASQVADTQAVSQATAGPSSTATISTPAIVTVGASATIVPSATKTLKPSKTPRPTATTVPSQTPRPTATPKYAPVVKASNFVKIIDNPYLPLTPGTTLIYTGTKDTHKVLNQVVVTTRTRKIMGVTCIEVEDTVLVDDKLEEKTLDWYAQDKQGNVWYFGETTKEYNAAGKVTSTAGSWLAGSKNALPGIAMQAVPTANLIYRQEYYRGHAEDMAQVLSLAESLKVTSGSYDNVLLTEEWTPLEPEVVENKWYAKGIGLIASKMIQGGNEEMQLTEVKK
jgi:hypothetical protein